MTKNYASSAPIIPLTLAEIAEAQALAKSGAAVGEIAEALSTTVDAVNDALAGKVGPHAALYLAEPQRRTTPLSPAEVQKIARLADLGTSGEEICKLFGITRGRMDLVLSEARRARERAQRMRIASEAIRTEARREIGTAPETEPSMRDLMRVPLRTKN